MKCKKCGAEFSEGIFCPECGEKYVPQIESKTGIKICTNCGAEFTEGVFCPECGTKYENAVSDKATSKKAKGEKPSNKTSAKKKSKLPLIIGAVVAVLIAIALLSTGGSVGGGSISELGDYLPKGKSDVMELISKIGLEEDTPGFYTSDDLRITTDNDGLIDTMTFKTSKYSLYGIKVGDEYSFDHFFKVLGDHSYVMMGEDASQSVWGITSGDQDRVIYFQLYSGKIDGIMFMRHGAYDIIKANTDNSSESSQETVTATTLSVDDPLYGVVSDDILTAFRSETEIGSVHPTDDPVFNEAGALGIWVRFEVERTLPDEVLSMGMDIISKYNWLFQLYSSQTVMDNFPNIYAYYYALKHESQTQQGENGETYKLLRDLYDDGEFAFSQELGQFKEDCKQFITECNNIVRAQRGL